MLNDYFDYEHATPVLLHIIYFKAFGCKNVKL